VLQYINKIAKPYVQPPRSRLITNTDSGQVILDNGANGIDVVQKDQTATDVAKKLLDGKDFKTDLSIKYAAAQTVEVQPYDKWFVADITTKRMYAYEGTTLVHTFLVSAGAPKTPTVLGKYAIYSKLRSQDMTGNNADGSRYFQPAVPYVNYFYGGYAIHGNYWRPDSWFGNINSSHGCIGVNVSDGAWIYNWAAIGTPVIVHS
jgi:lipoprotein-anchoring transpeptidase ErfK/SrfK